IKANESSFGKAVVPHYHFDRADIIVSFGADFLGTWISPLEFHRQWVSNRNIKSLKENKMSRHYQFEAGMSMTGLNADTRIALKPSEEAAALISLYNALGGNIAGAKKLSSPKAEKGIAAAAKDLAAAKGRSLVVSGSNDPAVQTLVNAINSLLGNYGTAIDLDNPSYQYAGNDTDFAEFVKEMSRGEVGAVFFLNTNPAYEYIQAKEFTDALAKVGLRVSFAERADETASLCNVIAPNLHYLESWADANPVEGYYTIVQPVISPVNNGRAAEEGLLLWSDNSVSDYYTYVKSKWERDILPAAGKTWQELLQTGSVNLPAKAAGSYSVASDLNTAAQAALANCSAIAQGGDNGIELQLYQSVAIRDGRFANNAWLQEMPDPDSKVTWDNYAAINPKQAQKLGISEFDLVEVKSGNVSITVPALYQPGQAMGTISIAVGYGREKAGKAGNGVGKNAYPLIKFANGTFQTLTAASISKAGGSYELAQTQTHHSYEGRNIIRETTFSNYIKDPFAGTGKGGAHKSYDLWPEHKQPGHSWV